MENWRKFVTEAEQTKNYGDLYLFEGDSIQKVSFYDRLMSLNESENDLDIFFEQWEKSANHELNRLNEVNWKALKSNPILYLSTQAYALMARAKDKIVKWSGKIAAVLKRARALLDRFKESNPKLYKAGALAVKIGVALLAYLVLTGMGGEAMAGELSGYVSPADAATGGTGDIIANAEQLEKLGELLQGQDSPSQQQLGAELIDIAKSSGEMNVADVAAKIDGISTHELERFVEAGVEKLNSMDSEAASAAQDALDTAAEAAPRIDQGTRINPASQAINFIGQAAQGSEDAIQKLIDLQDVPGAPEALKGVDVESLSKEELFDLVDQIRAEGPEMPDAGGAETGDAAGLGSKLKKGAQKLGQKLGR